MKGADKIIQARIQGRAPEAINFFLECPFTTPPEFGAVDIEGQEILTLDLRFIVGLLVCVHATNERRMMQMVDRCRKFKARQIAYGLYVPYY